MAGVLTLIFSGCREYRMYRYEPVEVGIRDCSVLVSMLGQYGMNFEEGGKKLAEWKGPYRIQFILEAPYSKSLKRLEVKDIEVTGMESGRIWQLKSISSEKVNDPRAIGLKGEGFTMIVSTENLHQVRYESYTLKAKVIWEADGKISEKAIEVIMKTNFKVERRSDAFDRYMGV